MFHNSSLLVFLKSGSQVLLGGGKMSHAPCLNVPKRFLLASHPLFQFNEDSSWDYFGKLGSLGFGEEALQSLPGNVGSQDVSDVLAAIDHVVKLKLAYPPRIAVFGGSHGGFLSAHLLGQAPEKFSVGAIWNPVCNLALMVGTTDIPDLCYINAYGSDGIAYRREPPSKADLNVFYDKSPISHVHKVKAPMLFLLGAQDLRVPVPDGLQYIRALKERGIEVKVIMFPDDVHEISRP